MIYLCNYLFLPANAMNKTADYEFTVIVPLYNEVDNIPELERSLSSYLLKGTCRTCVLFVDDGSTDGSLAGLQEICSRNRAFFYISFEKNRGLSAALKAGFDYACSRYIGYIDADLQTEPEDFDRLLPYMADYEMAVGVRVKRNDTFFKRFQSRFANSFVNHRQRTAGVSKFTIWNRMMSSFADCFAYRWMRTRYISYKVSATDLEN